MTGQMIMELIENGFLGQTLITVGVTITVCYLVGTSQPVPDWFQVVAATLIGYYFGTNPIAKVRTVINGNGNVGGK